MLRNCAGVEPGQSILLVHEEAGQDFYDPDCISAVTAAAALLDTTLQLLEISFAPEGGVVPSILHEAMQNADQTIFLARIGDQLRFGSQLGQRSTVCYALDAQMLGSAFGQVPHGSMLAIKRAVNETVNAARQIRVTCPGGTDFSGPGGSVLPVDMGIRRFPMSVFAPVSAKPFSGVVALPGFLVGTGSQYYAPYAVEYDGTLKAHFENGRLAGFSGDREAVARADAQYDYVSSKLGIDRDCVHSWHVGIHPGCAFSDPAALDFRRWSGSAFGNPRLLHFHTCGAYPPGEISWNVVDPTVELDGVALWKDGRLNVSLLPGGGAILDRCPETGAAFHAPARSIGI